MADWASDIEAALEGVAPGPAGRTQQPACWPASALAMEVVRGRATAHLLAQGIVLTTLLGRCALAEAEEDAACGEYRHELAEAAEAIVADWRALLGVCRRAGVPCEQLVGDGGESHAARSVVRLAQEIVAQGGAPPPERFPMP